MTGVANAGLVHRNLALCNILGFKFDPAQGVVHIKVLDFGMSKEVTMYSGGRAGGTAVRVRWTRLLKYA
jgi:hypothetical protein